MLPIAHPKVPAKCFNLSSLTLIGVIIDLRKFTLRPVDEAKHYRRALRMNNCFPHPSIIMRVSSAY
jgi:hypothetical protein